MESKIVIQNRILCFLNELNLHSSALRLAEIHHAEENSEDSLYLIALCYFRSHKLSSAYQILTKANCTQSKNRLLLGQCCYELGKYHEAEQVILGNDIKLDLLQAAGKSSENNDIIKEQLVRSFGSEIHAASAAVFLGSILEKTSRSKDAIELFRMSLDLEPYLWDAAEPLTRLPEKNSTSYFAHALGKHNLVTAYAHTPISQEFKLRTTPPPVKKQPRRSTRLYSIENNETPASRLTTYAPSNALAGAAMNGQTTATTANTTTTNLNPTTAASQLNLGPNTPAKKLRRADPEVGLNPEARILLETFRGLLCLNQFKLDQSITIFNSLPEKHRNTGWVMCSIGRAYYEKTNYNESVKYYESARKLEPYRLKGMEYYSSALWQLHKEVELSILAKELMNSDQEAPETWCAAGNCYSLQKEHESAIKYLERAIKVDPNFAYAYTLLGHELISAERLDQAITCFRNAVRLDPRHWNAWCGLGCIYYKNEVYKNAELYYKKALKIAPTNPVLMCQLAVVQHACKQSDAAIETLSRALTIDPDNALCRFHRATIYSALEKNLEALCELDELKRLVPKESMVYFLIGKIHKKIGNTHTALMNFSWAMELDPKGANNTIRDVIDKQHSGEDDIAVHRDQCVDA